MSMSNNIRIGAAHLSELQQGHGSPEAIRTLQKGQESIRKMRLLALRELAGEDGQNTQQSFSRAFDVLAEAEEMGSAVIAHPTFGAWSREALWTFRWEPEQFPTKIARLGIFAASAAIQAGMDFSLEVPVEPDGSVKIPMTGKASLGSSASLATITRKDGQLIIYDDVMTVRPPSNPVAPGDRWVPVPILQAEAKGLTLRVDLQDAYPDDLFPDPYTQDVTREQHQQWQSLFQHAWELLATHHPHYAQGIAEGFRSIILLNPTNGQGRSITSGSAFGAAAMTEPASPPQLACTLVHEFQHSKLYGLTDIIPMLVEGSSEGLYYAPWRDDPRPADGLLQGAFAHLAIADFWRLHRRVESTDTIRFGASREFIRWLEAEDRTVRLLRKANNLNADGLELLSHVETLLAAWKHETVPEEARTIARLQADDHEYSWRLHNLMPDTHAVRSLTAAFLEEAQLPPGEMPVRVIEENKGKDFTFTGQRSRYALGRLLPGNRQELEALANDPTRLKKYALHATPDDARLLLDPVSARTLFSDRIVANPHDVEAWIGLRLAYDGISGGLLAQPEVAAAIYQQLSSAMRLLHRPEDVLLWQQRH